MSANMTRIVLSVALLLFMPTVWVHLFAIIDTRTSLRSEHAMMIASVVSAIILLLGWLAIWWNAVRWTSSRIIWTIVVTIVSVLISLTVGAVNATLFSEEIAVIFAAMSWAPLFVAGLAIAWRERPAGAARGTEAAGADQLPCPKCGYNLRGLREARCPECGAAFTLDELYERIAAGRHGADIS